jgi:hypothetical protein
MEAKQRITVFCLTWGRRFAFTVNMLLLAALYMYIYTMIQHPDPLMRIVVIVYAIGAIGATAVFGRLWCSWHQRGRDKRSGSVDKRSGSVEYASGSDDDLEIGLNRTNSGVLTPRS